MMTIPEEKLYAWLNTKEDEHLEFKEARERFDFENLVKYCVALANVDLGAIERAGKGKYILSQKFYALAGKIGVYTRKKGLDRETNKALLLKHIKRKKKTGTRLEELMQVLPAQTHHQVQSLLRELKKEKMVNLVGKTRGALWYPAEE